MHVRHIVGLVLAVLTVPVTLLGLIDPMEGGIAMLAVGGLLLVTWLVSRIPVPRLEWIAWLATIVVGAVTVAVASVLWTQGVTGPGKGLPWWLFVMLAVYEVGVLTTLAGGIQYVVRQVKALRRGLPSAHAA